MSSSRPEVTVKLQNISVERNDAGGIFLKNLTGKIELQNISAYQNKNFGIGVSQSEQVLATNVSIYRTEFGTRRGDGIYVEQSDLSLVDVQIYQPFGNGISAVACDDQLPRPSLKLDFVRIHMPGGHSWLSARLSPCSTERWNWFPDHETLLKSGFEDFNQSNVCSEYPPSSNQACNAVRGSDQ